MINEPIATHNHAKHLRLRKSAIAIYYTDDDIITSLLVRSNGSLFQITLQ